jgi:hypothetical protein
MVPWHLAGLSVQKKHKPISSVTLSASNAIAVSSKPYFNQQESFRLEAIVKLVLIYPLIGEQRWANLREFLISFDVHRNAHPEALG